MKWNVGVSLRWWVLICSCTVWTLLRTEEVTEDTSSVSGEWKIGLCPHPLPAIHKDGQPRCIFNGTECETDGDCAGPEKCCNNGCAMTCTIPMYTGCQQLKMIMEIRSRTVPDAKSQIIHIPSCRLDGDFEPIQCSSEDGRCWCVNNLGLELAGTRAPAKDLVNCSAPRECAGYLCRMLCPYGFELDDDGCPICECKNLCKDVKCPGRHMCQVDEVPCESNSCPPVATCKQPRSLDTLCPFDLPLTSPDSGNPFLCGVESNKPQCPNTYACKVEPGNDYGVCCPLIVKSGRCPDAKKQAGHCGASCGADIECADADKCCPVDGCGQVCTRPANLTLCQRQKVVVELLMSSNSNFEGYIPQCNEVGEYTPKQCSNNGLLCWCVDGKGVHVRGTMGPPEAVECGKDAENYKEAESIQCPQLGCELQCRFGLKEDSHGCQTCVCSDPCDEINCPEGSECVVLIEEPCTSKYCSMATCSKKHSLQCHSGTPVTDSTGQAMQCKHHECPMTHVCEIVPGMTTGICCPKSVDIASTKAELCPDHAPDEHRCHGNDTCMSDDDCPGNQKCCSLYNCAAACMEPRDPRPPTMCEYLRDVGQQLKTSDELLAIPIPQCRPDGSYEPIQCDERNSECWCVDEFGVQMPNARAATRDALDCSRARSQLDCLGILCRLGCDYGFELDDAGCPVCECKNPCGGAKCPNSLECEMVEGPCIHHWCPGIPKCVRAWERPVCPAGSPMLMEDGNVSMICDTTDASRSCPSTHTCITLGWETKGLCCPKSGSSEKPGQCPYLVPVAAESCGDECAFDYHCEGGKKCCSNGCGTRCIDPLMLTGCQHHRAVAEYRAHEQGILASDAFLPGCRREDGEFERVQCDPLTRACWCVNEDGLELPGSRVQAGHVPSCSTSQSCASSSCDLYCPEGYEIDFNGCPVCQCRNPCKDFVCKPGKECRLIRLKCVSESCPPVPLCLPSLQNPCPNGQPLTDGISGQLVHCGPNGAQCPSTHRCHLSPIGEYATCCPKPRDACFQDHDAGHCNAAFPRWYFDHHNSACKMFDYGGCGGNMNNFATEEECKAACPAMTHCQQMRERNLRMVQDHEALVFIPTCNELTGLWDPVQCLDRVGLCWCVDRNGSHIVGSTIRGTPHCTSRMPRNYDEIPICSDLENVHVCPENLCENKICFAKPNATCRINPCGGCKAEFYDEANQRVDCQEGQTACFSEVHRVMNSQAWENQKLMAEMMEESTEPEPLPVAASRTLSRLPTLMVITGSGGKAALEDDRDYEDEYDDANDSSSRLASEMSASMIPLQTEDSSSQNVIRTSHVSLILGPRVSGLSIRITGHSGSVSDMMNALSPVDRMSDSSTRPGLCPMPSMMAMFRSVMSGCVDSCLSDTDCPDDRKCCLGECGLSCVKAVMPLRRGNIKPGGCPPVPLTIDRRLSLSCLLSRQECTDDSDCSGMGKCCRTACGYSCVEPEVKASESVTMMVLPPKCSPEGGYAITQRHGELAWCVDSMGRPVDGTLLHGSVRCDINGTILEKDEIGLVCDDPQIKPRVCRHECMQARCQQHPDAVCTANPCDGCRVAFFNQDGEKVDCQDKCRQPMMVGSCRSALPRFFYNQSSHLCEPFTYGGCRGNDNNFQTLEECQQDCMQLVPVCERPAPIGDCGLGPSTRWLYNSLTYQCELFEYGGCQDTGNSFSTRKQCEAVCPDQVLCPWTEMKGQVLKPCSRSSICSEVTCPAHPEATCTVDPCLCTAKFITDEGHPVVCDATTTTAPVFEQPVPVPRTRCQDKWQQMTKQALYVPQCTEDGKFEPMQCARMHGTDASIENREECWCVDEAGTQLSGSIPFAKGSSHCEFVKVRSVEVTIAFKHDTPPRSQATKARIKRAMREVLDRLGAHVQDDNMRVRMAPDTTLVMFVLVGDNNVEVAFQLEEMLRRGMLALRLKKQNMVADLRDSHFYHSVDHPPEEENRVSQTWTVPEVRIEDTSMSRGTVVGIVLITSFVAFLSLLILVAVVLYRKRGANSFPGSLVSMAFSSPLYGMSEKKQEVKVPPEKNDLPVVVVKTVEAEYESLQNNANTMKLPDQPPAYDDVAETGERL